MNRSLQWRKFAFFDKEVVCENVEARLGGERVTCASAESGTLLLGDAGGSISIADRNFQFDRKCKAFRGEVSGVRLLLDGAKGLRQFVVAVGDDAKTEGGDAPQYVIKVFNINDLARPVHAFHVNGNVSPEATVTAFAALPDGSQLAVGFSNSTVLLFSAPFLRSDHAPIRQLAPTVLSQQARGARGFPVAGLHFCVLASSTTTSASSASSSTSSSSSSSSAASSSTSAVAGTQDALRTRLFAVFDTQAQLQPLPQQPNSQPPQSHSQTSGGVIVYDTSSSSSRRAPSVLDDAGCSAGCSSYMPETRELVVGRDEGVFSYSSEDRGGAAGFEGSKQCVATVGRHILVCAADEKVGRGMGENSLACCLYALFVSLCSLAPHSHIPY